MVPSRIKLPAGRYLHFPAFLYYISVELEIPFGILFASHDTKMHTAVGRVRACPFSTLWAKVDGWMDGSGGAVLAASVGAAVFFSTSIGFGMGLKGRCSILQIHV